MTIMSTASEEELPMTSTNLSVFLEMLVWQVLVTMVALTLGTIVFASPAGAVDQPSDHGFDPGRAFLFAAAAIDPEHDDGTDCFSLWDDDDDDKSENDGNENRFQEARTPMMRHSRKSHAAPYEVPKDFCAPFGSYPNPLELTEQDRLEFAPVVHFPTKLDETTRQWTPNYRILDHTTPWQDRPSQLVSAEQHAEAVEQFCDAEDNDFSTDERLSFSVDEKRQAHSETVDLGDRGASNFEWFGVGRYDENRLGMYESDLFAVELDDDRRTVHVGIDLDGPVGTPVHAFCAGTVHAVGYNSPLGDYGNVIVIQHDLFHGNNADANAKKRRLVYALYGHLDSYCVETFRVGMTVKKGQVLGHMGTYWENGGWTIPHVHFQLSLEPPDTHDLPGAVAPKDRNEALWDYPDPRYVLGPLY